MATRRERPGAKGRASGRTHTTAKRHGTRSAPSRISSREAEARARAREGLPALEREPIDEQTEMEQAAENEGTVATRATVTANEPLRSALEAVLSVETAASKAEHVAGEPATAPPSGVGREKPVEAATQGSEPGWREPRMDLPGGRSLAREIALGAFHLIWTFALAPLRIAWALLRPRAA
jgi:hypothetical protein